MDRDINVNNCLALENFLAATVPMRTEEPTTLEILCRKLSGHPLPTDEKDHHSFLTPMLVQNKPEVTETSIKQSNCGDIGDMYC